MADHDYDRITIEPSYSGKDWTVYGHGVYPDHSVLAGQPQRVFLDRFDTLDEAREEWPFADWVLVHSRPYHYGQSLAEMSGLPEWPPDWFDPADCGETW